MANKRKLLLGAAGLAAVTGAAYLAVGEYFFQAVLSRKAVTNSRSLEDLLAGNVEGAQIYNKPYYPLFKEGAEWYSAQNPQKVVTISPRGERLHAELFRNVSPTNVWVICLHGRTSSTQAYGAATKAFYELGYNVLMPHLNGHGESESDTVSMGWYDRIDVCAWVDYLIREYENPQIILHGVSMGAATVMMTTGEDLPANVVCAIADCGYTSVWDEFVVQAKETYNLRPFPVLYALNTVTKLRAGFSIREASCVEQLKKSRTPTLFIHGDRDDYVPFWMLSVVYDAAACEKEMLVVPGAAHAEAMYELDLYYGNIKAFIDRYL